MDSKCNPKGFVEAVMRRIKAEDTAFRAAMSRADNPVQESCAWEYLIPFCNIDYENQRLAFALVGAAIARGRIEEDCDTGLGDAFKSICRNEDDKQREARRLRRIVAYDNVQELVLTLRPCLNYLVSKGARIGYAKLLNDLLYWNKDKARRWMVQFFHDLQAPAEVEG